MSSDISRSIKAARESGESIFDAGYRKAVAEYSLPEEHGDAETLVEDAASYFYAAGYFAAHARPEGGE